MLCHTRTPRLHEYATNVALHMGGGVYALVRAYGQAGARRRWRRAGRAAWVAWWAAGKEGGWTVGAWGGGASKRVVLYCGMCKWSVRKRVALSISGHQAVTTSPVHTPPTNNPRRTQSPTCLLAVLPRSTSSAQISHSRSWDGRASRSRRSVWGGRRQ